MYTQSLGLVALRAMGALATTLSCPVSLPIVDLGYELHQAINLNEASGLYTFSNIRYAQPPVGDLRWALPEAPSGRNNTIVKGEGRVICPQGMPKWMKVSQLYARSFANKSLATWDYNAAEALVNATYPNGTGAEMVEEPGTTEDCLFLDVVVPESTFKAGKKAMAPVLVWIHGGAYVTGNKNDSSAGDPSALIAAAQADRPAGFVYVSLNYRLGGLGFASGEQFEKRGLEPNLGLHDQRLAFEWVRNNIALFGGDPKQVTISGGSAGGGSVGYHLISSEKSQDVPFQQAWLQSPAFLPASQKTRNEGAGRLLKALDVSDFEAARKLSSEAVVRANADVISTAKTSTFWFSPIAGGSYITELPIAALLNKKAHPNIRVLLSSTLNEGVYFTPSYADTQPEFSEYLRDLLPDASNGSISYIDEEMFPLSAFNNSWSARVNMFIGDYGIKCYTRAISTAYDFYTYNYQWQIFPALHGYDFLNIFGTVSMLNDAIGQQAGAALRKYISNFITGGNPNGSGLPHWPVEGVNSSLLVAAEQGFGIIHDPTDSKQCKWLLENEKELLV